MNKGNKFLFDLNKFDEPHEEVEEDIMEEEIAAPPPPTFSEEELEAAKIMARAAGRKEGITEERSKREQTVSETLHGIAAQLETLFAAERYREKQYEDESVKLALEIIDQIAPTLIERFGQTELKKVLESSMEKQSGQSEIRIEIHPDHTADIDRFLEDLWHDEDHAPRYKVVANSALSVGACDIRWKDGGLVRNPQKNVQIMKERLESLLNNRVLENMPVKQSNKTAQGVTPAQNNAIKESDYDSDAAQGSAQPVSGETDE